MTGENPQLNLIIELCTADLDTQACRIITLNIGTSQIEDPV